MTGYRDRCYCKEDSCRHWVGCDRALTVGVLMAAREWWGTGVTTETEPPVSVFGSAPECFEESEIN